MVRPRRQRRIGFIPDVTYFKPQGIKISDTEIVELTFVEVECLRLSEIEELSQIDAAKKMDVHQSTFQRNLSSARKKIALAIIKGKSIKIQGGSFKIPKNKTGPEGMCICPECGHRIKHKRGIPCNKEICPKCQVHMIRE